MEYTKGKFADGNKGWKAIEPDVKIGFATHEIHWSDDGECVAEVVHGENEANLMAAAPVMYEALKKLMEVYDNKGQLLDYNVEIAREALKYAEGMI